ncbi:ras GTPase-activating protein 4 isoform X2 [Puntigrus tetrazona]|uniref:ras GTPase-activating protein 4 isoform X2 n=1 Tax=Puntigrus tetrazona TaxID=1606681 RepID=UPI001C88E989|nr:ras GTPase-activating protein 4 isoform X2 [Puntigrus tetrazona]
MAKRSTLFIRIVEGKNLPIKDITGSSDPYCIVKIDNEAIIRTATIWKTLSPFWGEEYTVHLPPYFRTVSFYVLDEDSLSRDDVIGKVSISKELLTAKPQGVDGWMNLTEIDPDEEVQGEIHLQISVLGDGDIPRKLCCQVLEARDLAKKDRNGASDPFVRVRYNGKTYESSVVKKSCYPRWNESFEFELDETLADPGLLSVEVWDWDLVSRNDFLGKVLFNINKLQSAQQEEGWFRLGPDKSKHSEYECAGLHRQQTESDIIQQSSSLLQSYLSELLTSILQSASYCPLLICQVFHQLYLRVQERFPNPEYRKVKFIAVTSFLCLRFISPAIMSPKLFHLREKHADARTSRTLLLLAKAVQTIGNMDTLACCSKEPWMVCLQPAIQQGITQLKDFITKLVNCHESEDLELQTRMSLQCGTMEKEGFLFLHRTKDKCMPMTSPFKKYYVTLSKDTLSYSRTQHSKKSSFISLPKIRAVEKVEEKCFGSANVMQIISSEDSGLQETLYLDCKSVNELNHWLSALRKACSHNINTMSCYHPGIYKADRWSCCHQKEKSDPGCDKTRHGVTLQEWYDPLDPDLEAQLIYQHLRGVQHAMRDKYYKLIEQQGVKEADSGRDKKKADVLSKLFSILQDLRDAHAAVEEEERSKNKNVFLELQT